MLRSCLNMLEEMICFFLTTKEFNEFESEVLEHCNSPLPSEIINSLEHNCEYMEYDLLQNNNPDIDAITKGYKAVYRDWETDRKSVV